jgi:hypothetical protein
MSLEAFTKFHVALSLIGILSGLVVLAAMSANRRLKACTDLFLASTVLTSATGFLFRSARISPSHILGIISLVVLASALFALYAKHIVGVWRRIFIVTAVLALYLNVFVGVAQAFDKLPALKALAPTGTEPPFMVAQAVVLGFFVALGWRALKRYRPIAALAA